MGFDLITIWGLCQPAFFVLFRIFFEFPRLYLADCFPDAVVEPGGRWTSSSHVRDRPCGSRDRQASLRASLPAAPNRFRPYPRIERFLLLSAGLCSSCICSCPGCQGRRTSNSKLTTPSDPLLAWVGTQDVDGSSAEISFLSSQTVGSMFISVPLQIAHQRTGGPPMHPHPQVLSHAPRLDV